ncbi:MAG: JAB domain-containing protein [Saprospiraceae bacterium]|nr:JAB domain-containing protein [Saprospiraceae bacterium]
MKISEIEIAYKNTQTDRVKLRNSYAVKQLLMDNWNMDTIELLEEFKIILLNRAHYVLGIYPLSKGGITGTVADVRLIFSTALKCNATSVILAHNHPSGNRNPSEIDIRLTKKIKKAGELLDIGILDHIILTKDDYYSFADSALM